VDGVEKMLSNCCGYSYSDLIFKRSAFEAVYEDEIGYSKREFDGLVVFGDFFCLH